MGITDPKPARSKGFLLPAIALLDRLRYPQKFALISMIFILPLGFVMFLLITEINSRVLFARAEIRGNACLRLLRDLMEKVPEEKEVVAALLGGDAARSSDLAEIQVRIEGVLEKLEKAQATRDGEMFGKDQIRQLRDDWSELRRKVEERDAVQSIALHDKLIQDIRSLISHVGDASNLILDPDLDTYYLMSTILLKLPENQELVSRMQYQVQDLLRAGTIAPDRKEGLIVLSGLIRSNSEAVKNGMEVAFRENPARNLRPVLANPVDGFTSSIENLLSETDKKLIQPNDAGLRGQEFALLSGRALDQNFHLWDLSIAELDGLLQLRIRGFQNRIFQVVAFSAAALLVILYLLFGFYASVMRTVSQMEEASRRMVEGDMNGSVRIESHDELAQVVKSFNSVAGRLRVEWAQAREESERARAAEEQLIIAKEIAETANRIKSQFIANMSHELRTPLNAIMGFSQLLETAALSKDDKDSVAHILRAGKHLLALINEILDIGRIEAGRMSFIPESVLPVEVIEEVIALVGNLAGARGIALRFEPPPNNRQTIRVDRQRFKQVLINLLSNAVKYNRDAGFVTIACQATPENRLHISVSDTGSGIAEENIGKLFEPFERFGADAKGIEGSGLGLTLAHRLVYAMGGTMGVKSVLDVGSVFWIEFPLGEATGRSVENERPTPSPAATGPRPKREGEAVVLYIEDNLANLALVEKALAHRPWIKLIPAVQGRLGLELARQHRPELILLDLHLPDLPGYDVYQLLLADPVTREIPVVVLSANATREQIDRMEKAGALEYLTKPIDLGVFLSLLDRLLGGAR